MEPQSTHSALDPLPQAGRRQTHGVLTRREREVAFLVAEGLKNQVIARRLALSPATVATYVQRIQARLGLYHRNQIRLWVQTQAAGLHPDVLPAVACDVTLQELGRPPVIGLDSQT